MAQVTILAILLCAQAKPSRRLHPSQAKQAMGWPLHARTRAGAAFLHDGRWPFGIGDGMACAGPCASASLALVLSIGRDARDPLACASFNINSIFTIFFSVSFSLFLP